MGIINSVENGEIFTKYRICSYCDIEFRNEDSFKFHLENNHQYSRLLKRTQKEEIEIVKKYIQNVKRLKDIQDKLLSRGDDQVICNKCGTINKIPFYHRTLSEYKCQKGCLFSINGDIDSYEYAYDDYDDNETKHEISYRDHKIIEKLLSAYENLVNEY